MEWGVEGRLFPLLLSRQQLLPLWCVFLSWDRALTPLEFAHEDASFRAHRLNPINVAKKLLLRTTEVYIKSRP